MDPTAAPAKSSADSSTPAWDYIVVGGGTAGCCLAARLSEDPATRVLLVEAGPRDTAREIHLPPGFVKLFRTELDWAYDTAPQTALGHRRLFWPRGRVLGGSSSLNAQLYVRGHRRDYDRWAAAGADGWSYADVLPYFKRSEDQGGALAGDAEYHGIGGLQRIEDRRYVNPLTTRFLAACAELGIEPTPDFNGQRQEGSGLFQVAQRRGARCSSATAYLGPARRRRNLEILTDAVARRLLLAEDDDGRLAAHGVEVVVDGDRRQLRARREVILAAGAIGSPHLLQLSGIGPAAVLRAAEIPVRHALRGVGENLQDHLMVSTVYRTRHDLGLDHVETLWNLLHYLLRRRGPFTTTVCEAGAFVRTASDRPQPDLQLHFLPAALIDHGFDSATDHGFNIAPTLLKPASRGSLRVTSSDPYAPPHIDPSYLASDDDLELLVRGVELARRLARSKAFADELDHEVLPGPGAGDRDEIASFIAETAATIYHPVGTCAMGVSPEAGAVVDPRLRVHGVRGLRVADASIMPEIPGGNTNAPTLMIAEKAADLIRGI
ncbi:MAG: GMC family oxidoreductase N-terminal domain-containing protein [Acidobacteriota bacterium]